MTRNWFGWSIGIAAAVAAPFVLSEPHLRIAVQVLYLGLFAVSFNVLFGYAGLLSLGHNAGFGVGGYVVAILFVKYPTMPLLFGLAAAPVAGAVTGLVVGAISARTRGSQLALLTLATSQILLAIVVKWRSVTHGDDGLLTTVPGIPLPWGGSLRMDDITHLYGVALVVVVFCLFLTWRILQSPFGTAIRLLRDNEERAGFLGYNAIAIKIATFGFASALAAVAGALFVITQGLVSPEALDLPLGGEVIFMSLLGGCQAFLGPVLGAALFVILQDYLSSVTQHWLFFIGSLFVAIVLFAPGGIVGLVQTFRLPLLRRVWTEAYGSRLA